jgi:hypothetical protein
MSQQDGVADVARGDIAALYLALIFVNAPRRATGPERAETSARRARADRAERHG